MDVTWYENHSQSVFVSNNEQLFVFKSTWWMELNSQIEHIQTRMANMFVTHLYSCVSFIDYFFLYFKWVGNWFRYTYENIILWRQSPNDVSRVSSVPNYYYPIRHLEQNNSVHSSSLSISFSIECDYSLIMP